MKKITSCQNIKVKHAAKLKSACERRSSGLFIAEGLKLINELVFAGYKVNSCFISENADIRLLPPQIEHENVFVANENIMRKISALTTPQDFIAVSVIKESSQTDISDDFILALDCIQDPANMGAILRSAEAFGVKSVILGNGCCDVYSPKALRAAMGSVFRLNIVNTALNEFLNKKKAQGYDIIGTGLDKNYRTVDKLYMSPKKVLIIGNEGNGISKEIRDMCSFGMYIPMYGENESLNAAVAASIIMWENKKQTNE